MFYTFFGKRTIHTKLSYPPKYAIEKGFVFAFAVLPDLSSFVGIYELKSP